MRLVLAGVSNQLASALRSPRRELDRASSAAEAIRLLQQSPAPRLLVVSETFPRAGDVLAAVEADCRLAALVSVVVLGDHTALAVALRHRGMVVLRLRGAGPRLRKLARKPAIPSQQARERLLVEARERSDSSRHHVHQSKRLIDRARQLCARSRGCRPEEGVRIVL